MNIAFVVGCQTYQDPEIASLKYSDRDADTFSKTLSESCGFKDTEKILLTSHQKDNRFLSSRSNILREISKGAKREKSAERIEQLFFFFSGHGFHSSLDNKDYLVTSDTTLSALEETSIPFETILKHLSSWNAKTIILFLDACRAIVTGGKDIQIDGWQDIDVTKLCLNGMASFCSCEPRRKSYELDKYGMGAFTYTLCEALSDTGKCKTIYELDNYLVKRLPSICQSAGKPVQIPYTRVEPLSIQNEFIVSQPKRIEWQSHTVIGKEIRKIAVKPIEGFSPRNKFICGIDFGTSYSVIATYDQDNRVFYIPSPQKKWLVPSVISFINDNLDYTIGWDAIENARLQPENTILNVKRLLGSDQVFHIKGKTLTPELLTSLILRSLIRNAEEYLSGKIDSIVVSVPANFNIRQSNALIKACEMTDLRISRLIGEPCASPILLFDDWSSQRLKENEPFLVVDLGGGTLDVSIMVYEDGVFETKSTTGDNFLGGLDYDNAISKYLISEIKKGFENLNDILSDIDITLIRLEAERVKISLGSRDSTVAILNNIEIDNYGLRDIEIAVTRDVFQELTSDLNIRLKKCIDSALSLAYLKSTDISFVFLAGQGSKIFTVSELITKMFQGIPIEGRYQESAVIRGLCRYSAVLAGDEKGILLLDANYTGIGVYGAKEEKGKITISGNSEENHIIIEILPLSTTIPIWRMVTIHPENTQNGKLPIKLVEMSTVEHVSNSVLGQITVEIDHTEDNLNIEIAVDCDANRTLVLWVGNPQKNEIRGYQLNNHYTKPLLTDPRSRFGRFEGLKTDGQVFPLEKLIPE